MNELAQLLGRSEVGWTTRRTQLQGWRGDDAAVADELWWAQRVAPAFCAAGALAGGLLASPALLWALVVSAAFGAVSPHHPVECAVNALNRLRGRPELPANRASKRFACALGAVHLGTATGLMLLGATTAGAVLAIVFGVLAGFVAITGICVPSIMFTLRWGTARATAPDLPTAFGR